MQGFKESYDLLFFSQHGLSLNIYHQTPQKIITAYQIVKSDKKKFS